MFGVYFHRERHNCGEAINFHKSDESLFSSSFSLSLASLTYTSNYLINFHSAFSILFMAFFVAIVFSPAFAYIKIKLKNANI